MEVDKHFLMVERDIQKYRKLGLFELEIAKRIEKKHRVCYPVRGCRNE